MPLKKTVVYFYPQQKKYLINWAIPFSQKPKKQEGSQGSDGLPSSLFVRSGKSVKTFSVCQINPCGPNISTEHGTKKHFQNQNQHQIAILNSEPEGYFQFRIRTKLHFWDQNQNQMDVVYPPIDYLVKKTTIFAYNNFPVMISWCVLWCVLFENTHHWWCVFKKTKIFTLQNGRD